MLTDRMPMRCVLYTSLQAQQSVKVWYGFYRGPSGDIPMSCNVAMAFTDCFGLRWRRDRDGQLTRMEPTENPEWVDAVKLMQGIDAT